jgi:hypothetical protein
MRFFRHFDGWFWLKRSVAALAIAFVTASPLWADGPPVATGPDYVECYGLTILLCILGLAAVGRSSHRTTEIKFKDED